MSADSDRFVSRLCLLRCRVLCVVLAAVLVASCSSTIPLDGPADRATIVDEAPIDPRDLYTKREVRIPMRDGVELFTAIYQPKDRSQRYPFLMKRTPYSLRPYGEDEFPRSLGPSVELMRDGYIFVYQDVRGCYMSEGTFRNMTPHVSVKRSASDIDESTDTYDTIDWLLLNVEGHNGCVGQWGISYPGFYAAAGMIDAHPALVAVSPQAPIADWYFDDFHHHGAFFLPHAFNFLASFGRPREGPTTERNPRFDHGTPDGYRFFLDLGPLSNANDRHLHGEIPFWNAIVEHPNYDDFWKARDILPHLRNVAPAVLTVGGWFDAEDLYGPLQIYRSIERENPGIENALVMGPWRHGGWARGDGDRLGNARFGAATSKTYRAEVEAPFFRHHLKGEADPELAEAIVFETGTNRWRAFDTWPPEERITERLYLHDGGALSFEPPASPDSGSMDESGDDEPDHDKPAYDEPAYDEFVSDPAKPVPYTEDIAIGMTREYMTDDQRFASRRPDVLTYRSEPLDDDVTIAGDLLAELWVSTSESAADWVVKVIDEFPPDAEDPDDLEEGVRMGGYQMMVRSEVLRGRYRNDYSRPEPFEPGRVTYVPVPLQDVLHTFRAGHRIVVQIQSTWFPLVDRNPQRYVDNIFEADEEDFVRATHRVYRSPVHATSLRVGRLPAPPE